MCRESNTGTLTAIPHGKKGRRIQILHEKWSSATVTFPRPPPSSSLCYRVHPSVIPLSSILAALQLPPAPTHRARAVPTRAATRYRAAIPGRPKCAQIGRRGRAPRPRILPLAIPAAATGRSCPWPITYAAAAGRQALQQAHMAAACRQPLQSTTSAAAASRQPCSRRHSRVVAALRVCIMIMNTP